MLKIFTSFLSGFNVISKKKGHRADRGIFFSDFLLISKKKGPSSEFCKFSLQFVRHCRARRREPQLSMVFGGKQKHRFFAGEKTPEFAKFQCENAGKNFALFALLCAYREHCLPDSQIVKLIFGLHLSLFPTSDIPNNSNVSSTQK